MGHYKGLLAAREGWRSERRSARTCRWPWSARRWSVAAVPRRAAGGGGAELTPVNSGGRGGRRRGQGASESRGQADLGVGGGRGELGRRLGLEVRAAAMAGVVAWPFRLAQGQMAALWSWAST